MSPDKQKLMEDIHSAYHRLWMLAESMEKIPGTSLPMIDEAKQDLLHMAGLLEDALAVSEKPIPPADQWTKEEMLKIGKHFLKDWTPNIVRKQP
jgi:hypothetical protein